MYQPIRIQKISLNIILTSFLPIHLWTQLKCALAPKKGSDLHYCLKLMQIKCQKGAGTTFHKYIVGERPLKVTKLYNLKFLWPLTSFGYLVPLFTGYRLSAPTPSKKGLPATSPFNLVYVYRPFLPLKMPDSLEQFLGVFTGSSSKKAPRFPAPASQHCL